MLEKKSGNITEPTPRPQNIPISENDKKNEDFLLKAYVYSTVNQFCERHPAFTKGGMRFSIFKEETNGLAESGAIVRMGRKVLINEPKFFQWLESQNQAA